MAGASLYRMFFGGGAYTITQKASQMMGTASPFAMSTPARILTASLIFLAVDVVCIVSCSVLLCLLCHEKQWFTVTL
jgi:hypothetical protein